MRRNKPPAERAKIVVESNIWSLAGVECNEVGACIAPPQPQGQQEFDAYWWSYHKEEPFLSMPEKQWRAIGAYFKQYASEHSFSLTTLYRRRLQR
jgi:hypothetical protein